MSLYNMLHGVNPLAGVLLKVLGLDQKDGKYDTGRFRDIYLNKDATKIILLTRNGGGNREGYQSTIDNLATHPNYITDYDDDFDSTYVYIEFSTPEEHQHTLSLFATGEEEPSIFEKTNKAIEAIQQAQPEVKDGSKKDKLDTIISLLKKEVVENN